MVKRKSLEEEVIYSTGRRQQSGAYGFKDLSWERMDSKLRYYRSFA